MLESQLQKTKVKEQQNQDKSSWKQGNLLNNMLVDIDWILSISS